MFFARKYERILAGCFWIERKWPSTFDFICMNPWPPADLWPQAIE